MPALLITLVALAGLVVGSVSGPRARRVVARYLGALVAVAFVGALARQIPFGPAETNPVFPAGRASLWLLPSLVGGLALSAQAVVEAVAARWPGRGRPLGVAILAVTLLAMAAAWPGAPTYQPLGTATMATAAEEALREGAVIAYLRSAAVAYAAEPSSEVDLLPNPERLWGFDISFARPGTFEIAAWDGELGSLRRGIGDADRVVVLNGFVFYGETRLPAFNGGLQRLGFRRTSEVNESVARVTVWDRSS